LSKHANLLWGLAAAEAAHWALALSLYEVRQTGDMLSLIASW
jgi:hypothetical protein